MLRDFSLYLGFSLWRLLPTLALLTPVYAAGRIVFAACLRRRGMATSVAREALLVLLAAYSLLVLSKTIDLYALRLDTLTNDISLVPFRQIRTILGTNRLSYILLNLAGNTLLFAPQGLMLPLLWKGFRSPWRVILVCLLGSIFIETMQLFCMRTTDIDDVMMNALGGAIGYALWAIGRRVLPALSSFFLPRPRKQR